VFTSVRLLEEQIPNKTLAEVHVRLLQIEQGSLVPRFPMELRNTPTYYLTLAHDTTIEPHAIIVFRNTEYVVGTHLLTAVAA
jgi:hypothetical protein